MVPVHENPPECFTFYEWSTPARRAREDLHFRFRPEHFEYLQKTRVGDSNRDVRNVVEKIGGALMESDEYQFYPDGCCLWTPHAEAQYLSLLLKSSRSYVPHKALYNASFQFGFTENTCVIELLESVTSNPRNSAGNRTCLDNISY